MSESELKRLTPRGLDELRLAFDGLARGEDVDIARILHSEEFTEIVNPEVTIEVKELPSRRDAAEYFYRILQPLRDDGQHVEQDSGMWAWLAASWLDLLAPPSESGERRLGEQARWIPQSDDFQRYYRHLFAGPYRIFAAHHRDPDSAMSLLASEVARPGDVVEQLASRQEIVVSPGIIGAATKLYYDASSGKLKRGAGAKGPGSARRLSDLIAQLDLTHDIYAMSVERVLELLPQEFSRFLEPEKTG